MSDLTVEDLFDQEEARERADAAYQEMWARTGESNPQPRLDATRKAVELLGDPHRAYPIIHVTGTNGKTSTSRIIESILRATGLRTGLVTSPHLERVNERIVIDGEPVDDQRFADGWDDVKPFIEMVDAELAAKDEPALTFFEALTVLSFAIFADAPVDVAVIEVGMGGEWDSTNVADGSVAVFTPIDLDHTKRLGDTVDEIARTKSGIIKDGAIVVTAQQRADAAARLVEAAVAHGATIHAEGEDFGLQKSVPGVGGQLITVQGRAGRYEEVFLPIYGEHQAHNAALAIAAVESFLGDGSVALDADLLAQGLGEATSPGRLQLLGIEPTVLIDAAHNPHGATALVEAVRANFNFEEIAVVVGVLGDKDVDGILAPLATIASRFYVTASASDRAIEADELAERAEQATDPDRVIAVSDPVEAVELAREWADEGTGRGVLVTGSITILGEVLAAAKQSGWAK
ncbi:MAG: folylpolyglutamate synthase/dihydrofolate synthase family protein [Microbacteriaceae bacterium]